MKNIIISIIFFVSVLLNHSCAQTPSKANKSQAQALTNEAGKLLMKSVSPAESLSNTKKVISLLKTAVKLDNSSAIASQTLISCYIRIGNKAEAANVCSQWISNHPYDPNARLQRGKLYYSLKNFQLSKRDFNVVEQSLSKQDTVITTKLGIRDLERLINLSYVYYAIGNQKNSHALLERLKVKFPQSEDVRRALKELKTTTRDDLIRKFTGS